MIKKVQSSKFKVQIFLVAAAVALFAIPATASAAPSATISGPNWSWWNQNLTYTAQVYGGSSGSIFITRQDNANFTCPSGIVTDSQGRRWCVLKTFTYSSSGTGYFTPRELGTYVAVANGYANSTASFTASNSTECTGNPFSYNTSQWSDCGGSDNIFFTVYAPAPTPTARVNSSCTSTDTSNLVTISWPSTSPAVSWVDISNNNFGGWWNKYVGGATSTNASSGFGAYTGVSGSLTFQPSTWYATRLWNGSTTSNWAWFYTPAACPPPSATLSLTSGSQSIKPGYTDSFRANLSNAGSGQIWVTKGDGRSSFSCPNGIYGASTGRYWCPIVRASGSTLNGSYTFVEPGTYTVVINAFTTSDQTGTGPRDQCSGTPASLGFDSSKWSDCGGSSRMTVTVTPDCNTGADCNLCSASWGTCSANNGSTICYYRSYTGGGACNVVSFGQSCTINKCNPGTTCISGSCIAPPPPPSLSTPSCPAPGTTASFSWSGNNSATTYYELFIDNKANPWGSYSTGNDSANRINSPGNSFSSTTFAGDTYGWWMTACNAAGCSSKVYGSDFTCAKPNCNTGADCNLCSASWGTCSANNGSTICYYRSYTGGGACNVVSFGQSCTINKCNPGTTCAGGSCVGPPPTPSISAAPVCTPTDNRSMYTLSWSGTSPGISYVDISTNNFASWSNKYVGGVTSTSISSGFSNGFTLQPNTTYYVRTWNGYYHSSTITFTTPVSCECNGKTIIDNPTDNTNYTVNNSYNIHGWGTFCSGPNGTNRNRVDPYICDQGTWNNCKYIGPSNSTVRQDVVNASWTCGNLNPNPDGWTFNWRPDSSFLGSKTLRVASINDPSTTCVEWDGKNINILLPPAPYANLNAPTNGSSTTIGQTISVSATAAGTNLKSVNVYRARKSSDLTKESSWTLITNNSSCNGESICGIITSWTPTAAEAGQWVISVNAFDNYGQNCDGMGTGSSPPWTAHCNRNGSTSNATVKVTPPAPTGLSGSCPVPGQPANFNWNGNNSATSRYDIFAYNKASGWGNCGATDYCQKVYPPDNTFTWNYSTPGVTYGWWMRACTADEACSSDSYGPEFTCIPHPTATISLTNDPQTIIAGSAASFQANLINGKSMEVYVTREDGAAFTCPPSKTFGRWCQIGTLNNSSNGGSFSPSFIFQESGSYIAVVNGYAASAAGYTDNGITDECSGSPLPSNTTWADCGGSDNVTFTVKPTVPIASITYPANNAALQVDGISEAITVTATAQIYAPGSLTEGEIWVTEAADPNQNTLPVGCPEDKKWGKWCNIATVNLRDPDGLAVTNKPFDGSWIPKAKGIYRIAVNAFDDNNKTKCTGNWVVTSGWENCGSGSLKQVTVNLDEPKALIQGPGSVVVDSYPATYTATLLGGAKTAQIWVTKGNGAASFTCPNNPNGQAQQVSTDKWWCKIAEGVGEGSSRTLTGTYTPMAADTYTIAVNASVNDLKNNGLQIIANDPSSQCTGTPDNLATSDTWTTWSKCGTGSSITTVAADPITTINCGGGTNPRAEGLVTTPILSGKFGTTGKCATGSDDTPLREVEFRPFKIPTYNDLKSIYYDQSRSK